MASTKSVLNKLPKKVALVVMVIVIVAAIALADLTGVVVIHHEVAG